MARTLAAKYGLSVSVWSMPSTGPMPPMIFVSSFIRSTVPHTAEGVKMSGRINTCVTESPANITARQHGWDSLPTLQHTTCGRSPQDTKRYPERSWTDSRRGTAVRPSQSSGVASPHTCSDGFHPNTTRCAAGPKTVTRDRQNPSTGPKPSKRRQSRPESTSQSTHRPQKRPFRPTKAREAALEAPQTPCAAL